MYGASGFDWHVVEFVSDKSVILEREQYWIDYYRSANQSFGFNVNPTASGAIRSEQTCKRISEALTGKPGHVGAHSGPLSDEQVINIKIRLAENDPTQDIADDYKVSALTIWRIAIRKSYTYIRLDDETESRIDKRPRFIQGNRSSVSKLNQSDVRQIKRRIANGEHSTDIALDFSVSISDICMIKKGTIWSHVLLDNQTEEALKNAKRLSAAGTRNGRAKLNDDDVRKIRTLLLEGVHPEFIAPQFKVSKETIKDIKSGRHWKHVV